MLLVAWWCRFRGHVEELLATLDGDVQLRRGVWWLVPRAVEVDYAALAADERARRAAEGVAGVRARGKWRCAAHPTTRALSAHDLEMLLSGQASLSLQVGDPSAASRPSALWRVAAICSPARTPCFSQVNLAVSDQI